MKERLQKVMAQRGICSRRKAEELIAAGKVRVNGTVITKLGTLVDPSATIDVDSTEIKREVKQRKESPVYILLHKPVGYISSSSNEQGTSVLDLIAQENYIAGSDKAEKAWNTIKQTRLYPVGRLDKDSEGLVLLTNDGELANKLTHPKYEHEKEYDVTITGRIPKGAEKVLQTGMDIGKGEFVRGVTIKQIKNIGKRTIVTVILKEGKNRQIRRMFGKLGMDVISLKRTRIGSFRLKTLPVGKWVIIDANNK